MRPTRIRRPGDRASTPACRTPTTSQAGDRAPDGLLPDGRRLFDVFRGPHWTVLEFGRAAADFGIPQVRLSPGPEYDVPAGSYVLVRPDGHLAAITDQPEAIREQLRRFDPVRAGSAS